MSKSMMRILTLASVALLLVFGLKTLISHAQAAPTSQKDVLSSQEYKTVEGIQDESSKTKQLTDEQLATLASDIHSQSMLVRLQTLVALRHAAPKQAQAALAVARKGFASPDGMTRSYALTTLDSLDAPDTVLVAKSLLTDRSRYVTAEAHQILTKRGVEK